MARKITLAASIAGILGTIITVYSTFLSSTEATNVEQNINGEKNTVIGNNSGNVTINFNAQEQSGSKLVVGREIMMVSEPDLLKTVQDKSKHVCNSVTKGTPVTLTGRVHNDAPIALWKEVKINGGDCLGKVGWIPNNALEYK